jgi:tetratricopeptide (TPR) repeat protein
MIPHRLYLLLFILLPFLLPQNVLSQDRELDSLTGLLQKSPGVNERMEVYFNIGSYWYGKGEYKKAMDSYQKIVDHCEENKQKCLDAKNLIAFNLIVLEEYDKAEEILKTSLKEAPAINYQYALINANRNLGLIHTYKGDYEEAAKLYLNAIEYSQKLKNKMKEADLYADLGMNYYFQDNYEKAAQYWEKAIEVKPDKNSTDYIGYCANLGQAYVQLKNTTKPDFIF